MKVKNKINIFLQELRSYQKSTIIWVLSLGLTVIIFMSLYPSFSNDINTAKEIFGAFPPVIQRSFGINLEYFGSVLGFYSFVFTYILLIGSIQAMNLGTGIISKEQSGKTVDFLLSKPVSRLKVLVSKISAAIIILLITNFFFVLSALIVIKSVASGPFNQKVFLMISAILILVQLIFLSLGFLVSVIIPKIKSVITITLPVVFGFFIIGMFDSVIGLDKVRYITPFKLYDMAYIISNQSIEAKYLLFELAFVLFSVALSCYIYIKKDIHSIS